MGRVLSLLLGWALIAPCLAAAEPLEAPGDDLILLEGSEFEVVCIDRIAGIELLRKSERFAQQASRLFREVDVLNQTPVRVVAVEPIAAGVAWSIDWGARDQVVLTLIPSNESSGRYALWEGFAAAWMMREAAISQGVDSVASIPEWLVPALALEYQQSESQAVHGAWANLSRTQSPQTFQDLLELSYAESSEDLTLSVQAWRLLDRLIALAPARPQKLRVAQALLSGADPSEFVSAIVFPDESPSRANAEVWWLAEWDRYIWDGVQRVRSLDLSRADLERLAYWSLEVEGGEVWLDASHLMDHVGALSPELEEAIATRITQIKRGFARINPAYVNALHSLGLFYEAILLGRTEAAGEAWQVFSQDVRTGQEIRRVIRARES